VTPLLGPDQQPERQSEPPEDHAHLQPGRGELPHAGDYAEDHQPEGHDDPVVTTGTDPLDGPAGKGYACGGADEAEQHREPLDADEGESRVETGQGEHPEGVGVHLHPFADVEHRSVAGQQIADDPEVDECVFLHPPVVPGADEDDDQGHGQE
jgi:hypothetical protein